MTTDRAATDSSPELDKPELDKSLLSNALALLLVVVGLLLAAPYQAYVLNTGLFALSGGLTNWLAIHMLFERMPGLYGSGVVQLRFVDFKRGIRNLIVDQFFRHADLEAFFAGAGDTAVTLRQQLQASIDKLDLEQAFDALVEVIMQSSFAGMLGMLGGRDALNALKPPFVERMRGYFAEQLAGADLQDGLQAALRGAWNQQLLLTSLQRLIDQRLEQMTPAMVKDVIQQMIRRHLGWLVVWGCGFGGLIGLLVTIAQMHFADMLKQVM